MDFFAASIGSSAHAIVDSVKTAPAATADPATKERLEKSGLDGLMMLISLCEKMEGTKSRRLLQKWQSRKASRK
jgi:hypothetical protein